jgi:hypothetical protein
MQFRRHRGGPPLGLSRLHIFAVARELLDALRLGCQPHLLLLVRNSLPFLSWSWASGWVLGTLSRRMVWVNGSLFCLSLLLFNSHHYGPYQYQNSAGGWLRPVAFYTAILPFALEEWTSILSTHLGPASRSTGPRQSAAAIVVVGSATVTALAARSWFWWACWR